MVRWQTQPPVPRLCQACQLGVHPSAHGSAALERPYACCQSGTGAASTGSPQVAGVARGSDDPSAVWMFSMKFAPLLMLPKTDTVPPAPNTIGRQASLPG